MRFIMIHLIKNKLKVEERNYKIENLNKILKIVILT